ncbi:MAG: hypothetical protein WC356_00985 [Candidatus Micrarchaeia archaeon]|jgi:hypothetical protein
MKKGYVKEPIKSIKPIFKYIRPLVCGVILIASSCGTNNKTIEHTIRDNKGNIFELERPDFRNLGNLQDDMNLATGFLMDGADTVKISIDHPDTTEKITIIKEKIPKN